MNLKKSFLLGAAVGALLLSSPASAETLREALVKAYLNNPEINSQRAALRATDEDVSSALSNWRPDVTWSGSIYRERNENNARTGDNRKQSLTPTTSTFTVTQPLFRGFRTVAATEGAEADVKKGRFDLAQKEQDVLMSTVQAYSNVIRDMAVLELNKNNEQVLRRQFEATTDRFEVGELTRTDVSQAQARFAKSTADRIQSEGDLISAKAEYTRLVGEEPTNLLPPTIPSDIPNTVESVIDLATKNNPSFMAAYYDEQSAMKSIDEASGELLPELNLEASTTTALESSSSGSRSDSAQIGLTLSVPFYQQGSVYSKVRKAKQTAAKKRMDMELARTEAVKSAKTGWEGVVTARARIQSFLAQIRSAEVALDGVQREAAVGSRTVLDVLDAEQELLDAKVSLVRAQRDELVAVFELKQAIGELTAEKLRLDTGIYDPDVHYQEVRDKWFGTSSVGDVDEMK